MNLADLYYETGEFKKAEPILFRSEGNTGKNVLGKEHPDYAANLR